MCGDKDDLAALNFIVDEASASGSLIKTIVFFETCILAYKGFQHLQQLLPLELQSCITFLHSFQSTHSKQIVMKQFKSGSISILCATEATGMVSRFCPIIYHSRSHIGY